MTLVAALGWIAALAGVLLGVPQAVRLWRSRDVEGVSLLSWQAMLVLNLAFGIHGVLIGQVNMILTNSLALVSTLPILILLAAGRQRPPAVVLAPALSIAALIVGLDLALGSVVFGAMVVLPIILVNLGQGVDLVRAPVVSGVSPLYLILGVANQALWLIWAALLPDVGTVIGAGVSLITIAFNLLWLALRRLGLRAFFVSVG